MLTAKQLLLARRVCAAHGTTGAEHIHNYAEIDELAEALRCEIERRLRGPYTLAEAISSGYSFKRPHWPNWVTFTSRENWTPGWPMDLDDQGNIGKPAYINREDQLACDYIVMETR